MRTIITSGLRLEDLIYEVLKRHYWVFRSEWLDHKGKADFLLRDGDQHYAVQLKWGDGIDGKVTVPPLKHVIATRWTLSNLKCLVVHVSGRILDFDDSKARRFVRSLKRERDGGELWVDGCSWRKI
jgi:hypothetical protein